MKTSSKNDTRSETKRNHNHVETHKSLSSSRKSMTAFFDPAVTTAIYRRENDHKMTDRMAINRLQSLNSSKSYTVDHSALRESCLEEFKKTWLLDNPKDHPVIRRNMR